MILDTIRDFLAREDLHPPFLLAISGGADSTALLVAFAELEDFAFEAAHINHHLRGADSDLDEAFVRSLCDHYGVVLHVADGTLDPDEVRRSGVETAARKIRYARLRQMSSATIVTAHQKNDQAETIFMRLIAGGGIAALRGIHPVRADGVIRPLLAITRTEIDRYLAEHGITPRVDRSNTDPRFLRNRVRGVLGQFDHGAVDSLASIAAQARDQWRVLEYSVDCADDSEITETETRFNSLPDDPWLRRALLHRHIRRLDPDARDVSAADLDRIANDTAKRTSITASVEMIRRGNTVILRRNRQKTAAFEVEAGLGEVTQTPIGPLTIRLPAPGSRKTQLFELPRGAEPRFTIRNRRNGDRFQPLGMSHQKKLKDFLIDRKIPAEVRDSIPLVVWRGEIVWVAGVEISQAFKVAGGGELYEVSIGEETQESLQRESDRGAHR